MKKLPTKPLNDVSYPENFLIRLPYPLSGLGWLIIRNYQRRSLKLRDRFEMSRGR